MSQLCRVSIASAICLISFASIGCGGSSGGVIPAPINTSPPTALAIEPDTITDATNLFISANLAVRGPRILVGEDSKSLNTVWVGNKKFYFSTPLSGASLSTANADYAVGSYSAGSLVWPYRTGGNPITVTSDSIFLAAKNQDVFFDSGLADDFLTQTANMMTIKNGKAVLVPYKLPPIDPTQDFMIGVAINGSGAAIIEVVSFSSGDIVRPTDPLSRRAFWNKFGAQIYGTLAQKKAALKARLRPGSTGPSTTGYYIISTTQDPIPLALPNGSLGVDVTAMNDRGYSVGVTASGDPNNPSETPCYWDANGNTFPMQLTSDVNFGFPEDINSEGAVVGEAGTDTTGYGAIWTTLAGPQVDINTLLPKKTGYTLFSGDSIGDDFDLAVSGTTTVNAKDIFYIGLTRH